MKIVPALLFFLVLSTGTAGAADQTVYSSGSNSDQITINNALETVYQSGEGTVYLKSDNGPFIINGPVYIGSNTILIGAKDAIIKVSKSSSQWFTGRIGIISYKESLKNVEIYGFQINGNCGNLPASYANTPGHDKDCERCILLWGDSGNYAENIKIHDMQLYDSFSDGIYLFFATNSACYNNFISNCQHEGIFWSVVLESEMYNNQIAGITSDCMRLDNCVNCKVHENVLFSYDGDNLNGAYPHGENGLQVGDAGSSHGYDASNKPTTTTNIEIYGNTFANNGLAAIAGSGGENVYIHDNEFVDVSGMTTRGVSFTNPPTKEMSEKIFNSIFDILSLNFTETENTASEHEQTQKIF